MEWRRQFKIDTILTDFKPSEVLKNYVSAGLVGQDKALSPRMRSINIKLTIQFSITRYIFVLNIFSVDYALWKDGYERNPSFGKKKRFHNVRYLFDWIQHFQSHGRPKEIQAHSWRNCTNYCYLRHGRHVHTARHQ